MRFGFGKANTVKPGEQTNKMCTTILIFDGRNVLAFFGQHYPGK